MLITSMSDQEEANKVNEELKVLEYEQEVIEREKLLKFYRARSTLSYTRV